MVNVKILNKLGLSWAKLSTVGVEFIGLEFQDFPALKLTLGPNLDLI